MKEDHVTAGGLMVPRQVEAIALHKPAARDEPPLPQALAPGRHPAIQLVSRGIQQAHG